MIFTGRAKWKRWAIRGLMNNDYFSYNSFFFSIEISHNFIAVAVYKTVYAVLH